MATSRSGDVLEMPDEEQKQDQDLNPPFQFSAITSDNEIPIPHSLRFAAADDSDEAIEGYPALSFSRSNSLSFEFPLHISSAMHSLEEISGLSSDKAVSVAEAQPPYSPRLDMMQQTPEVPPLSLQQSASSHADDPAQAAYQRAQQEFSALAATAVAQSGVPFSASSHSATQLPSEGMSPDVLRAYQQAQLGLQAFAAAINHDKQSRLIQAAALAPVAPHTAKSMVKQEDGDYDGTDSHAHSVESPKSSVDDSASSPVDDALSERKEAAPKDAISSDRAKQFSSVASMFVAMAKKSFEYAASAEASRLKQGKIKHPGSRIITCHSSLYEKMDKAAVDERQRLITKTRSEEHRHPALPAIELPSNRPFSVGADGRLQCNAQLTKKRKVIYRCRSDVAKSRERVGGRFVQGPIKAKDQSDAAAKNESNLKKAKLTPS